MRQVRPVPPLPGSLPLPPAPPPFPGPPRVLRPGDRLPYGGDGGAAGPAASPAVRGQRPAGGSRSRGCVRTGQGLWRRSPVARGDPSVNFHPPFPRSGKVSRWFGVAQSKSAKTNVNILHQEELIAQKKREIEARLEQQAKQNYLSIQQLPLFGEYV